MVYHFRVLIKWSFVYEQSFKFGEFLKEGSCNEVMIDLVHLDRVRV